MSSKAPTVCNLSCMGLPLGFLILIEIHFKFFLQNQMSISGIPCTVPTFSWQYIQKIIKRWNIFLSRVKVEMSTGKARERGRFGDARRSRSRDRRSRSRSRSPRRRPTRRSPSYRYSFFVCVCLLVVNTVLVTTFDQIFRSVRVGKLRKIQLFERHRYNSLPYKV
jgi:hypothetical protein